MNPANDLQIVRALISDAAMLSVFAENTFRDTYGPYNTTDRIDRYVSEHFSESHQKKQLEEDSRIVLIAKLAGEIIAYSSLRKSEAPDCVRGQDYLELERFYVQSNFFGRGIAGKLMSETVIAARADGISSIWLGVWKENPRAIAYYRKSGFSEVGEHIFVLAGDFQQDLVFELEI